MKLLLILEGVKGIDCFDFVNSKDFAPYLTKEETEEILNYAEWYIKRKEAGEKLASFFMQIDY